MLSTSEENYLKAIYKIEDHHSNVSTNSIAEKLNTKASSVTDMIKKLSDKELISYKKYKGVQLTELGKTKACIIIRKHRLWEVFLVNKLGFKWSEVHDIAEQLEHIKSDKLIGRLDSFLNFPSHDPHGDPIPDQDGNLNPEDHKVLSQYSLNEQGVLIGVKDSSDSFLNYLDTTNISLGTTLKVTHIEPYDFSLTVEIDTKKTAIKLSKKVAENLLIKSIKNEK